MALYYIGLDFVYFSCITVLTVTFFENISRLQLQNTGTVPLEFNWMVVMDDFTRSRQSGMDDRSTVVDMEASRPATAGPLLVNSEDVHPSSVDSYFTAGVPYTPFSITPENGTIAAGKILSLCVKFSPLDVNDYEARLICRSVELKKRFIQSACTMLLCVKL